MLQKQRMRERGFTIVELVLTMSVIGLMVGVWLTVVDFTNGALDRAARRLESDLRYAQQLATAQEINFGVITNNATTYTVYRGVPGTPTTDPHTRQAMVVDFTTGYDGVTFTANYQVEFDPFGRPVVGGGTQFILNLAGQQRRVTVTTTTGYVQVQ